MKWLFVCLAVFLTVAPAMAGEDPYIAIVGNDCVPGVVNSLTGLCPGRDGAPVNDGVALGVADPFYFKPKHTQFMYNQTALAVPVCFGTVPAVTQFMRVPAPAVAGCESFFSQTPVIQREVCDEGLNPIVSGLLNAKVSAGNAGFFEWWIRLPKKPSGEINIVIECGVLKPNTSFLFDAIELCAAETGERIGAGFCTRQEIDPGNNPLIIAALPRVEAVAFPGPYNTFAPFHLTAFKNPSSYTLSFDPVTGAMSNNTNSQILDGSTSARILLKACMDKTIVTKLPVTGQMNAFVPAETENDLEAGDLICVTMKVPRQNTVDVFCNAQSARLAGIGEFPF